MDGWGGAEAGQLRMGLDWRGDPRRCLLWVSGQWRARVVPGGGCQSGGGGMMGLCSAWLWALWVFPPRNSAVTLYEAWKHGMEKGTGKGNGKEEGKKEWEWEKEEDTVFRNTRPTLYVCFFSHLFASLLFSCPVCFSPVFLFAIYGGHISFLCSFHRRAIQCPRGGQSRNPVRIPALGPAHCCPAPPTRAGYDSRLGSLISSHILRHTFGACA